MSSHAETQPGREAGHGNNESALENLTEGISKVIDSVRIAIGKVFTGLGSLFKKLFNLEEHKKAESHAGSHGSDHKDEHSH